MNNATRTDMITYGGMMSTMTYTAGKLMELSNTYSLGGYLFGAGLIAWGMINKDNKYDKYFQSQNTCNAKKEYPRLINTVKKDYGYDLTFTLPSGLSLLTFNNDKTKASFENYLNAKVEFSYKDNVILAKVITVKLQEFYPYEYLAQDRPSKIVVGYSTDGIEVIDLAEFPHMLIAGSTGSGKSVSLRSIITSLALNWERKDLQLNLIDFKRVELAIFKDCGIVNKFITTISETDDLLKEMEVEAKKRFKLLEEKGMLYIQKYNETYKRRKLPYIINIIDEFAMMEDSKETLQKIKKRLAFDRACGIYYIIATQRPSVDILPGSLKANIMTKLSFKTSTAINSEIILDETGGELLKGKGNGLLKTDKVKEIQTMFLSEDEARKLIEPTVIKKEEPKIIVEVVNNANQEGLPSIRRNRKV